MNENKENIKMHSMRSLVQSVILHTSWFVNLIVGRIEDSHALNWSQNLNVNGWMKGANEFSSIESRKTMKFSVFCYCCINREREKIGCYTFRVGKFVCVYFFRFAFSWTIAAAYFITYTIENLKEFQIKIEFHNRTNMRYFPELVIRKMLSRPNIKRCHE